MRNFSLAAVNIRRNQAMHALLETNAEDDVLRLFMQEPWPNNVWAKRNDNEREGRIILGGAA